MERPRLRLMPDRAAHVMDAVALIGLVALWIIFILNYNGLPDQIATHFNFKGEADHIGNKSKLIALPLVASVIYFFLSLVCRFPHQLNYPVAITAENAGRQYKIATRLLRALKVSVVLIFHLILYVTISQANEASPRLGSWFLPVMLIVLFVPIIYFIGRAIRQK